MSNHEEKNTKSGIATAGLVLGIIGVCTSFMPIINNLSFVMGIIAVILGLIAIKKAGKCLEDLTLSEMDVYWNAGKQGEERV